MLINIFYYKDGWLRNIFKSLTFDFSTFQLFVHFLYICLGRTCKKSAFTTMLLIITFFKVDVQYATMLLWDSAKIWFASGICYNYLVLFIKSDKIAKFHNFRTTKKSFFKLQLDCFKRFGKQPHWYFHKELFLKKILKKFFFRNIDRGPRWKLSKMGLRKLSNAFLTLFWLKYHSFDIKFRFLDPKNGCVPNFRKIVPQQRWILFIF